MNVELWSWNLDVPDAECRCLSRVLSGEELARAARFIGPLHAARYTVGRGRLRQILGWYTGRPPAALAFRYGAHGKPYLTGPGRHPFFSLSHSGPIAMLGIAEVELGIDLELIRPSPEQVEDFFSVAEQAALSRMVGAERIGGFYRCWTRKEAVLKALGGGSRSGSPSSMSRSSRTNLRVSSAWARTTER